MLCMVKNKMRLCSPFLFLFPFWFFFILCFLSLKKNVKSLYILKNIYQKNLSKKLPSWFYRSWRIGKDRIHFIHSTKNPLFFHFVLYFLSYLFYFFTLACATFKDPSKWHARYKVRSAELFWFICCFCSNEMDMISSKLEHISEVVF